MKSMTGGKVARAELDCGGALKTPVSMAASAQTTSEQMTPHSTRIRVVLRHVFEIAAIACAAGSARAVAAQEPTTVPVNVVVRDSSGRVVPGADVAVVIGLNDRIASTTSDDHGRASFTIPAAKDYQFVVRKIGFTRSERFLRVASDSTVWWGTPFTSTW